MQSKFNVKFEKWMFFFGRERLKSVSKFLADFYEPFDMDGCADRYALKHDLKKEEVIAKWQAKGDRSKEKGTLTHTCIENLLKYNDKTFPSSEFISDEELSKLYALIEEFLKEYEVVFIEKVVADPENGYAAILDCLLKHKTDGHYFLLDWKTNESISTSNTFEKFKYPLNYLQKSDLNLYSLQLSLIANALKKDYEIDVTKISIVHVTPDAVKEIPIKNMSNEISRMFNFQNTKKDGKI